MVLLCVTLLWGCSSTPEKSNQPTPEAVSVTVEPRFYEGTFVAPGVDFSGYRRLIVAELGFDEIEISLPSTRGSEAAWELTDEDRRFFRSEYTHAVVANLVADGAYTTAINPAEDVLLVRSRILEIASLNVVAPSNNPGMAMYNESVGTMVITMELYDSMTNRLIGTITNRRSLAQMQANNNRAATNIAVRQAFVFWLKMMRTELDALAGRLSPLESHLR